MLQCADVVRIDVAVAVDVRADFGDGGISVDGGIECGNVHHVHPAVAVHIAAGIDLEQNVDNGTSVGDDAVRGVAARVGACPVHLVAHTVGAGCGGSGE